MIISMKKKEINFKDDEQNISQNYEINEDTFKGQSEKNNKIRKYKIT